MAEKLVIDDRIEKMEKTEAYITVKYHEEGFSHKLLFHLINPFKSDIGKIRKNLDKINNTQYRCKPMEKRRNHF